MAVVILFFYFPASQAVYQSFLLEDAFGLHSEFVWFENFQLVLKDPDYWLSFVVTAIFSVAVAGLSLSLALLFAVMADSQIRGANAYKTMMIWPYAVAPAVAGVLWLFMFQPSLGILAQIIRNWGVD